MMQLGEWNGKRIRVADDVEYIDGTAMAKANGKRINHWLDNETTKEFVAELELITGIPVIKKKPGRYGGTFVHRRAAIHLAQWCSPKFAVWVTARIDELIATGRTVVHREHQEAALEGTAAMELLRSVVRDEVAKVVKPEHEQTRDLIKPIGQDVAEIKSAASQHRKDFPTWIRQAATACCEDFYVSNGRPTCPCCDEVIPSFDVLEFHHWRGKGGCEAKIVIPLRPQCHADATAEGAEWHDKKESEFAIFQKRCRPYFESNKPKRKTRERQPIQNHPTLF